MASNNFSILGLYNYSASIFDNLELPSGVTKDVVTNNILMDCAELELIYPDFDMMRAAIGFWSKKELPVWEKLYSTTKLEYNPIWNKDGEITETETIGRTHESTEKDVLNTSATASGSTSSDTTSTDSVAGFNSSDFENKAKNVTSGTGATESSSSGTNNRDNSVSGKNDEERTYVRKETGNIGVTTTQSMIMEERDIDTFNIYDVIVSGFKKRFCLLVY